MTDELRQQYLDSIEKENRRMRRDKKYRLAVYVRLGIMTPKGNFTKRWRELLKYIQQLPDRDQTIRPVRD